MNYTEMDRWDNRFFQLCALVASWSEDQSRKVGAVIVGPAREVRAMGFNGLPRGITGEIAARHDRTEGEKYLWFEHAERNAIYNAARSGTSIEACSMYTNLFPCADCARALIQSGIRQLNTYSHPEDDQYFMRSYQVAVELFREAGIELRVFASAAPSEI